MRHLKQIVEHAIDGLNNRGEGIDKDDLHNVLFNEDYFVVGYYAASELLKEMGVGEFEAVAYVTEQEEEMFGEVNLTTEDMNSERITNLLAYYKGQELIYSLDSLEDMEKQLTEENVNTLIEELEELL